MRNTTPTPDELRRLAARVGHPNVPLLDGKLPAMAGGANSPVTYPLGGATVLGTTVTVDSYVSPPTKIPARIAALAASNFGYFMENVLATPGTRVEGGAVLYEIIKPTDLFLPTDQGLAPRAPGAEAPRLGAARGEPAVAKPESWSGSIEVTDEARRRNDVIAIQNQFTRAANSITNAIQTTFISALTAFVEAQSRTLESPRKWTEETKSSELIAKKGPLGDFALVQRKFVEDKTGIMPDTLIIHPEDWESLLNYYAGFAGILTFADLEARMAQGYGVRNVIVTVLATKGAPYFLKSGTVGALLFDLPISQEQERVARRKTDVYVIEVQPVIVLNEPAAVLQLTKINE